MDICCQLCKISQANDLQINLINRLSLQDSEIEEVLRLAKIIQEEVNNLKRSNTPVSEKCIKCKNMQFFDHQSHNGFDRLVGKMLLLSNESTPKNNFIAMDNIITTAKMNTHLISTPISLSESLVTLVQCVPIF
jgi:hypothetical protein